MSDPTDSTRVILTRAQQALKMSRQGLSHTFIARQFGLSRKTVSRMIETELPGGVLAAREAKREEQAERVPVAPHINLTERCACSSLLPCYGCPLKKRAEDFLGSKRDGSEGW